MIVATGVVIILKLAIMMVFFKSVDILAAFYIWRIKMESIVFKHQSPFRMIT